MVGKQSGGFDGRCLLAVEDFEGQFSGVRSVVGREDDLLDTEAVLRHVCLDERAEVIDVGAGLVGVVLGLKDERASVAAVVYLRLPIDVEIDAGGGREDAQLLQLGGVAGVA